VKRVVVIIIGVVTLSFVTVLPSATAAAPALADTGTASTLYVSTAYIGGTSSWLGPDGEQPMLTWEAIGEVAAMTGEPAEVISTERVEQMRLPAEFVKAMRSVITPGTTVLVTQAKVSPDTTGREQTVLDAGDDKPGT